MKKYKGMKLTLIILTLGLNSFCKNRLSLNTSAILLFFIYIAQFSIVENPVKTVALCKQIPVFMILPSIYNMKQ